MKGIIKFDLESADTEEIVLDPNFYSSGDKLGDIMKNSDSEKIVLKYLGEMKEHLKFGMMKVMTLDAM